MSYNYLGLVNKVCQRLNEVPLTSSNFSSAGGFYAHAKEAVNSSIRKINQMQFEWPFNHVEYDETLVAGQVRYAYQADAKSVDFDSFRIQRNDSFGNDTKHLQKIDYDEYLHKYVDAEYNTSDTGIRTTPLLVFRTPDREFGVYPAPDKAYTLTYEYFQLPTDLSAFDDVPSIPVSFEHVIVDGAMVEAYRFRGDTETADRMDVKFKEGIDNLRKIYINRYEYIRDTRILKNRYAVSATVV